VNIYSSITAQAVHLSLARNNLTLDAALIVAAADVEISLVAPVRVPRVGNNPVRSAGINTPAEHLDCVAAKHGA
jgi:hypothetical protein